jgi:hypothetical protein
VRHVYGITAAVFINAEDATSINAATHVNAIADLFGALPDNACDVYRQLCSPEQYPKGRIVRDHCDRLWRTYSPFADPQFLAEFPLHFHQRWSEMYLAATLIESGVDVQRTAPPGPDILAIVRGRRVWIEAICGTGGQPGLPDSVVHQASGLVPWNLIALRIRSSVEEKRVKYAKYLEQGLVKEGESLLIALNVHDIPHASLDVAAYVFRALYGVGNQVIRIALPQGGPPRAVGSSNEQLITINKLSTGAPVGTQPFIDGSISTIAGVIVSGHDAASAAHRPSDLTLYPNLTAATAWIPGSLPLMEWQFKQGNDGWQGEMIASAQEHR